VETVAAEGGAAADTNLAEQSDSKSGS
jgi:hypothetical protein